MASAKRPPISVGSLGKLALTFGEIGTAMAARPVRLPRTSSKFTTQSGREGISITYTGLPLDWSLISRLDNTEANAGKREYLARFGNLPTVDHTSDAEGAPSVCDLFLARERREESLF